MICTDLFRDICSHFVSPANLQYDWLKNDYWNHTNENELNLFYMILRDMCNISPHKNGWGNLPESKDICASACIERINIKGEEIAFRTDDVSNPMFENDWKELRSDIVEIEQQFLDGHLYEKRIDDLYSTDTYFVEVLASRFRDTSYRELGKNVSNDHSALEA